jgi:excisionase family DNA binding protein
VVYSLSEDESVERRLSVSEAAEALGVTRDAIHKRITRGSIRHEKGEAGRLYVFVDVSTDESKDESKAGITERYIAYLERQVEEEREARRRADTLLAQLMQRIPELEAPAQEPPGSPESPVPSPTPTDDVGGPQEATEQAQARPWWRFW